jgi:hypothetical protein
MMTPNAPSKYRENHLIGAIRPAGDESFNELQNIFAAPPRFRYDRGL